MNRIATVLFILATGLIITGCNYERPAPRPSPVEDILKGEHKLRKMTERAEVNSKISGSFFLFVGSLNGTSKTDVSVKFAWQMNDGIYAISSIPLEKIRINPDEKATIPTIKFCWRPNQVARASDIQKIIDNDVYYVVITAKESDWPMQVNLPLNNQ